MLGLVTSLGVVRLPIEGLGPSVGKPRRRARVQLLKLPRPFFSGSMLFRDSGPAQARTTANAMTALTSWLVPSNPDKQCREYRSAKDDPERRLHQIAARRLLGELAREEFDLIFDQGEV